MNEEISPHAALHAEGNDSYYQGLSAADKKYRIVYNTYKKMKKRKIIMIILAFTLLFSTVGIATGLFDKVVSACKAFIYCEGAPLETKK